jgi:hypothetical protein
MKENTKIKNTVNTYPDSDMDFIPRKYLTAEHVSSTGSFVWDNLEFTGNFIDKDWDDQYDVPVLNFITIDN